MKARIAAEQKRMEREYNRLNQCYSEFNQLKRKMADLVSHASTDPVAAEKLSGLNGLFPEGIQGVEQRMKQDINVLNNALKKLQAQIKQTTSSSVKP